MSLEPETDLGVWANAACTPWKPGLVRADGVKRLVVDGELFCAYGCFGLSEAMAAQCLARRKGVFPGTRVMSWRAWGK